MFIFWLQISTSLAENLANMGSTEIHGVKSMLCPSIVINEIIALSTLSKSFESAKENIGKNFFEKMTSFH